MIEEFFKFFDSQIKIGYYMHLEIGYNKVADYCIRVWRKGCKDDGTDLELVDVQDTDIELAFAKAYVQLKEWLIENEGGY